VNIRRRVQVLGIRDVTKQAPIRLHEHIRIGSVTKTFNDTVVLQLVEEGWLELDDPISRHLAGVPNGDNITIRHLLNMTSGLYNHSEDHRSTSRSTRSREGLRRQRSSWRWGLDARLVGIWSRAGQASLITSSPCGVRNDHSGTVMSSETTFL
jgi:CubicO group peptidase (beta-lactamase class C family)